jgi:2-polyprenyl-3-methyl-5-hydroxy-6-metoxy-1,4-benzoquinol methylase
VPNPVEKQRLVLYQCPDCRSYFFEPRPETDYSGKRYPEPFVRYYQQQGVCLEFALTALSPLKEKKGRLLDVGCGPGYMVDYWERMGLGSATGLEPSFLGDLGRQDLKRNILKEHLEECAELSGKVFDVVLCTEVIEHVAEPGVFLKALSQKVAPGGMLIFSTPAVGELAAHLPPPSNLREALSPGLHVSLFSESALQKLLAALGWSHVKQILRQGHWLVYASQQPFLAELDEAWARETHQTYLQKASQDTSLQPDIRRIFSYRLFREYANRGQWNEAEGLLPDILFFLPEPIADWIRNPSRTLVNNLLKNETLQQWSVDTYHLPTLLYLFGIRSKNHLHDSSTAVEFFKLASRTAKTLTLSGFEDTYTTEIYWASLLNAGITLLETGQEHEGISCLEKVGHSPSGKHRMERSLLPPHKFVVQARIEIFKHWVLRGNWKEASLVLPALQGFLATQYGPDLLRLSFWLKPGTARPTDWSPFWYFYCENMLALNTGHSTAAEGFRQLEALCRQQPQSPEAKLLQPACLKHAELARQQESKRTGVFARLHAVLRGI